MIVKHAIKAFTQFHWLEFLNVDELVHYFDEFYLPELCQRARASKTN